VLTGVHVGGYGSDLDTDLSSLVRAILEDTELPRLRFASVEPWDLPEDFWQLFGNPRLMPHMGTKAARLPDPVPKSVATERSRALHRLAETLKRQTLDALVGTRQRVLWEGHGTQDENGLFIQSGYTENFVRVQRRTPTANASAVISEVEVAGCEESPRGWVLQARDDIHSTTATRAAG